MVIRNNLVDYVNRIAVFAGGCCVKSASYRYGDCSLGGDHTQRSTGATGRQAQTQSIQENRSHIAMAAGTSPLAMARVAKYQ
jgi:hypothetical protein